MPPEIVPRLGVMPNLAETDPRWDESSTADTLLELQLVS